MSSYLLVFETEEPIATPLGETDHIAIDSVDPINIEPRHSAMGIWSVDTAGVTDDQATAIEQFAAAKARTKIYVSDDQYDYDDLAISPGPLHNTRYQEETGELSLEGEDAAYYLLADSSDIHYENETVPDALRDYWSRIDGFDAQVDDAEPRLVAEGVLLQSPIDEETFEDLFDGSKDDDIDSDHIPVEVTDDGIKFTNTSHTIDLSGSAEDPRYTGGSANEGFFSEGIGFQHSVPAERLGLAVRIGAVGGDVDEFQINLGDVNVTDFFSPSSSDDPYWVDLTDFISDDEGDFSSGPLTAALSEENEDPLITDCVAVWDQLYHDITDFEDDEVHEDGGYLSRPRRHGQIELVTDATDSGNAIAAASLAIEMDSTDADQRIQLSFDGETWLPDDGSEENTETISVDNDDVATVSVQGRVRLSGYSPDGPQDATPRFGYAGQTLESWELDVDLSSLGVIEDDRFDDDHLSNLQELHSRGDYRFTLIPDESTDDTQVRSYQRGTWEIDGPEWHVLSRNRNRTTEDYWNVVTVKGPRDGETGERPVTTREDADEIDRVGQELEMTEIRNDLHTEADRATVATQELLEAADATDVTGEIEAAPTLILPGPRYDVDGWGWVDLEDVQFSDQYDGGNVNLTFDKRAMLVDRLSSTQNDLSREKR